MFDEVCIMKYDKFTIITEYGVFAGGHFENGPEYHFCNGNFAGDMFSVKKYHKRYSQKLDLEDHGAR
jgi:hypothetical protein